MEKQRHIQYAAKSIKGRVRRKNQDNLYLNDGFFLREINDGMAKAYTATVSDFGSSIFAVFDGMGGESAGETAAYIAAEQMYQLFSDCPEWKKTIFPERFLRNYYQKTNVKIDQYRMFKKYKTMGTTAATLLIHGRRVTASNIGDSRIYRFNDQLFEQISIDHSENNAFVGNAALTQFLGIPDEEMQIEPYFCPIPYRQGDQFLLCTDGVWGCANEACLRKTLLSAEHPADQIQTLFDMVAEYGEPDNATAILLKPG